MTFPPPEYQPSLDDPPIDHDRFMDPRSLDRSEPTALLEPHPELWSYWLREMDSPDALDRYWTGGIACMHDPRYLRDVVRQHEYLVDGGDSPMPAVFAERMETLLASAPDYAEMRQRFLANPWKRALKPDYIRCYYLPAFVETDLHYWVESRDPFSETSLRRQMVLGAMRSAEITIREAGSQQEGRTVRPVRGSGSSEAWVN